MDKRTLALPPISADLLVIAQLGLAGTGDTYRFRLLPCALLTLADGIVSFLTIQNPSKAKI